MKLTLDQIAAQDGRYDVRALKFVYEGLGATIDKLRQEVDDDTPRHITGQQLAYGLAELAKQRWGRLAAMVLNYWGVKTTRDFGEIVYLMIAHHWMTSQETDRIEDFDHVYDFTEMFENQYVIDVK